MHHAQRHLARPTTVEIVGALDEALTLLQTHGTRARIIAGGTDLLLEIDRGVRTGIEVLIDITRLDGMSDIEVAGGTVVLGPLVTHNQVVRSAAVAELGSPLLQACWEIGSPQLRNRATVAGNLITASPANDTISALRALDASVSLTSTRGSRSVALADFYTGVRGTVMEPDEALTEIRFPAIPETGRGVFVKLGLRRAQAISVVHVAAVVVFDGERVASARIAAGSVAPTIIDLTPVEEMLRGATLDPVTIGAAADLAASIPSPIDDLRGTADYRRAELRVMVERALTALSDDAVVSPVDPVTLWGAVRHGHFPTGPEYRAHVEAGTPVSARINGERVVAANAPGKTLLDWLRDDAGPASGGSLTGTKEGCAEGECGACTVYLDGIAVMACLVPAARASGADVVTIEGLGDGDRLHPLQDAFVELGAVQCGFCIPGFLMAGAKLLEEVESPRRDQVRTALSGNLCRCTGYYKIMDAVDAAAAQLRGDVP
ncbi:MAG TPA: FAD binding domain-containing protein [Acidimicrobiia bacterium]|jgi:carbon-monoxide dehydrogenase medium subunit